jgi:hypothetical protein
MTPILHKARGRPLNLDDGYEHLREVWFSHGVRQKVLTERAMARFEV